MPVVVYGAGGHTGRFVVAELQRRGLTAITAGRSGLDVRIAEVSDARGLDRVLRGASAIINCAGPFMDTAVPLVEAALRARIHYLDVCAEQVTTLAVFERFDAPARAAGIAVVPAMGFFGGLADLLATVAVADWPEVDQLAVGVALDRWHPTAGTRTTGQRNTSRRLIVEDGRLAHVADPAPRRRWSFDEPFGELEVVELPLSEIITISRHLRARSVHSFMNVAPLADLADPLTPPPVAVDASGRSAQRFAMEVVARRGDGERRASACGRDIYAVTAPLVVGALERLLGGRFARSGAAAAGELFDAAELVSELRVASPS